MTRPGWNVWPYYYYCYQRQLSGLRNYRPSAITQCTVRWADFVTLNCHLKHLKPQPKPVTCSEAMRFENVCPKSAVSPIQIGDLRPPVSTTLQLNDIKFNGLYLWNETWYRLHNGQLSALDTARRILHCFKLWTLVHKRLKIGPEVLPTLCKFCTLLQRHASQTEIYLFILFILFYYTWNRCTMS